MAETTEPPLKTTAPRTYCFVLMPFSSEFDDTYKFGIKAACTAAGAYCERVDEQIFHERILDRIYNQIAKADIIVADMTGRNPNVFYEVGYAHALGKLTILLTKDAADIPFDLKHFPHIVYGASIATLLDELTKRVRHYIANPPATAAEAKSEVDLYWDGHLLGVKPLDINVPRGIALEVGLVIQNVSATLLRRDECRIGFITTPAIENLQVAGRVFPTIPLPDGRILRMIPPLYTDLFPTASDVIEISLWGRAPYTDDGAEPSTSKVKTNETLVVKLFTPTGAREFPVTMHFA